MKKKEFEEHELEFLKLDARSRVSRFVGELCLAIGANDFRTAVWNIMDLVSMTAYKRGYNQALEDMENQKK